MKIKKNIKLLPEHIKMLESLPEQGMGYQLIDIELKSGTLLKNRVVLNSTYLQLHDEEELDCNEISKIKLHKT